MQSIRSIYKKGIGPSSSHTMGPAYAAADFHSGKSSADIPPPHHGRSAS